MPVLAVNSEGVSFAMSFICGLSTIATLISPPFVAGDPPDDELFEPPPQPTTTAATTAQNAATDPGRRVPGMRISPPAQPQKARSFRKKTQFYRLDYFVCKAVIA